MDAPHYVQGNYSVSERDRILGKADNYPDASEGLTYQVPTLMPDGSIGWRQQSSGGGDGTANANLAVVEESNVASQPYAVGDLLVYGGQLYEVTAAISAGDTIASGTNVTPTTMGAYVQEQATGGGVTSFNGRTGAVTPQSGDYTASDVGALPSPDNAGTAGQVLTKTANGSEWAAPTGGVTSFNGRTGAVVPVNGDYKTPYRPVTLLAANWSSNAQTVTVTGVSATETDQLILPVPASASRAEYQECGVQATAQAANNLTFTCTSVPASDLTVYVCMTELEVAT